LNKRSRIYTYVLYLVYPSIHQKLSGLFPSFGYGE
jgi:hypothetical protein